MHEPERISFWRAKHENFCWRTKAAEMLASWVKRDGIVRDEGAMRRFLAH